MNFYIYLGLLVIMGILIYNAFENSVLNAPVKIKILTALILAALMCRYITLFFMILSKNIKYLYSFEPVFFINILCIPICALVCIYILSRNDKIKILYIFIISILLACTYGYVIYQNEINIVVNQNYYSMYFVNQAYVTWGSISINTLFLIIGILLVGMKNLSKTGITLIIVSSIIAIGENMLGIIGLKATAEPIIGDTFWMITLNYSLSRLKK